MPIYIRFENNKQVEATTLQEKPKGWHEAPENFSWQKNYCLTEKGKIAQCSDEEIKAELLQNAKSSAINTIRIHFNNYTGQYVGYSYHKAKSYNIQAKAAEKILAAPESIDKEDSQIIEPLAKVRGISVVQMAQLIQEKAKTAVKAIIKCEELEDLAKVRIKGANEAELQSFLDNFAQQIKDSLKDL